MSATPLTILPLDLSGEAIARFTQLNTALGEKLEQVGSLRPEMLADLNAEMKRVLEAQPAFPAIAERARDKQVAVHVTHADSNILNLPWRLAVQDFPLLFLTKGKPAAGELPLLEADNPPLKILVMISSPEDADYDSRLNYEEEEDKIMEAFAPLFDLGQVQVDFTDDGSLENLAEKLAANRYHILHFSGHGIYHKNTGYLALEDHLTMNQRLVKAEDFARVFQQKPSHIPALVVLSSCQTAKGGTERGMQSVADELLRKGLPAVVAMSVSVSDYFATYFASVLYQKLAEKEPLFRAFQNAIKATRQHEHQVLPKIPPTQWMIPQLLLSKRIGQPVDFSKADDSLKYAAWKFVSGRVGLQTEKREGYRFVGRRRDRKRIFQKLADNPSVLLLGQGGVGKTAMAEYIIQRMVAKDQNVRPFIFNETNANLNTVISSLKLFLEERNMDEDVMLAEKNYGDHAFNQFRFLFGKIKKICHPVFIFDNMETFQSEPGGPIKPGHSDLKEILEFLYKREIPLVLTCRYPVAECPDIPPIDLNQVGHNDFLKKALQLSLKDLPKKMREKKLSHIMEERLTFREVVGWLRETFGGNYRALEFFDEIYAHKKDKLNDALNTLAAFKKEYVKDTEATRQRMSKNLLFGELLKILDGEEKHTLQLLAQFRIPVLPTALQMQKQDLQYADILKKLRELTLAERHVDVEDGRLVYFYVTPLVNDLVREALGSDIDFSAEQAGQYHYMVDKEINQKNYNDLIEAFEFFIQAKNGEALNETGNILSNFYYETSQFQNALNCGLAVYNINGENTEWGILNRMGLVFDIFGNGDDALYFYKICEQKATAENNLKREGTTLNNISQIFKALGDYATALSYLERSLKISQEIGDKQGEGTTLNNISLIFKARGDYSTALSYLERSLKISQEIGDKKGESVMLGNIGNIYLAKGDYEKALNYFEKDIRICQEIGDKKGEGVTLNNISQTFKARGDYATALSYLERSLKISQEIGDKKNESTTLGNIGNIYLERGDYKMALKYFEKDIQICQEIGDKQGQIPTLHNMAMIAKEQEDFEKYFEYEAKSYQIAVEIGDGYGICIVGEALGIFLCQIGNIKEGLPLLERSLEISKNSNLPDMERILNAVNYFRNEAGKG